MKTRIPAVRLTYDNHDPRESFLHIFARLPDMALLIGFVPSPEVQNRLGTYDFKPLPEGSSCEEHPDRYAAMVPVALR